ncbi:kinase-like domain-containing protein [Scheffersomyces amazonensis]|uniref:kinase-like domain-containing protein n=1 Tax=Scheffersomyces amazonensis TaxID=1078765 RepID=UPI00315DCCDE
MCSLLASSIAENYSRIIINHYRYLTLVAKEIISRVQQIDVEPVIISRNDTSSNPSSSSDSRFVEVGTEISDLTFSSLSPADIKVLGKITKLNWVEDGMSFIRSNYEFVEIVSGSKINSHFGVVIKIRHKGGDQFFICKIYDPVFSVAYLLQQLNVDESFSLVTRLFNKEISSLTRLQGVDGFPDVFYYGYIHREITTYNERFTINDFESFKFNGYWFIEEYFDAIPLKDISLTRRRRLYDKTVSVLQRAHDLGVYHGDITDSNILVTEDHEIKIVDFGFAILEEFRNQLGFEFAEEMQPSNLENADDIGPIFNPAKKNAADIERTKKVFKKRKPSSDL